MPKHTPTQFYNTLKNDGMKLRSGKTINYQGTTSLAKATQDLQRIVRECNANDIAYSYRNRNDGSCDVDGPEWITPYYNWGGFTELIDNLVGERLSTQCTRLYATERFVASWRKVINQCTCPELQLVTMTQVQNAILVLDQLRDSGCARWCGCSNLHRKEDEEYIMKEYRRDPSRIGYISRDRWGRTSWVATPEVCAEQFEGKFYAEQKTWRHDLQELRNKFQSHLDYFKRVPQRDHQEVYFTLASCKIGETCAKKILAFFV